MTTVSRDQLVAIAQDGNVAVKPTSNLYDFEHHRPVWWKCEIICVLCCEEWVGACPIGAASDGSSGDRSWWECPECHAMSGQTVEVIGEYPRTLPSLLGME
jgi:hypothetical protein